MLSRNVSVNVFKSDAVFWWAATFRTPSSMLDKMLHLPKSQGSTMNRLRSHDLREAISDLLTVTMYLQDSMSRFHRPGLHKIDFRVHVASRLAPLRFTNPRAVELSVHSTIVPGKQLHILLHRYLVAIPSRAPPTSTISSDSPELRHTHVLLLGGRVHGIPRVFDRTFYPNCNSRVAATIVDVSSPICIGQHHDGTLRRARSSRNIKIATNDHVACRISYQIPQQTLDVDFITSGSCAAVSGQLTNCVLNVRTIQPE